MRKIRGGRGILEVDAADAVFSQTGNRHTSPYLKTERMYFKPRPRHCKLLYFRYLLPYLTRKTILMAEHTLFLA